MKFNHEWVYRIIHHYNLLINIKTNEIIRISPLIGTLFNKLKCNKLETEILRFEVINNITDIEKIDKLICFFKSKGVFIDE